MIPHLRSRLAGPGRFLASPSRLLLAAALASGAAAALPDEPSATLPIVRPPPAAPAVPRQNPTAGLPAELPPRTAPEEIPVAGWSAGAVRVPSSPDAWGGPRTGKEPTLSPRVADYAIQAVLDPVKHTIDGTQTLTWRNRSDRPVKTLWFHTYLNAFEGPGSTFMTEKARYGGFRSGVDQEKGEWGWIDVLSVEQGGKPASFRYAQPDGGPATDRSVLRVELPEAVPPGGETKVALKFHDQLPRVVARTGWFGSYHLAGQWYPKIGVLELAGERGAEGPRWNCHELHLHTEFYADWGAYDLEVIAPKGFTVAASGLRTREPKEVPGGVSHAFRAEDVHDVAFTAWDGYAPPLTGTYTGPGSPTVTVTVLFPPEQAEAGRVALQATLDSLKYFSETLGPYPYKGVTVIVPPFNAAESAGMEYETFFTTVGGKGVASWVVRYVTVHEFGHGYFMGLLASNEAEEPFLDEGMNELWGARMLRDENAVGDSPWFARLGLKKPSVQIFDFERITGTQRTAADTLAGNAWDRWSSGSYGMVYPRTATAFHDLEQELGADTFAKAMKLYHRRWHFRHPSTADLKAAFLDAGAAPAVVERFWETQVFGAQPVDDAVEVVEATEVLPRAGTVLVEGKRTELDEEVVQKQIKEKREAFRKARGEDRAAREKEAKGQPGAFPWKSVVKVRRKAAQVPQTLVITFEDGSVERVQWPPGERWRRFEFERPAKVEKAQLDPDRTVLLDVDKLDDGRLREPDGRASRRWTLEAAAWIEALFAIGGSL